MFPSTWLDESVAYSFIVTQHNNADKASKIKYVHQKRGSISDADTKRHVNGCDYHSNRNIGPHHPYVQVFFLDCTLELYLLLCRNEYEWFRRDTKITDTDCIEVNEDWCLIPSLFLKTDSDCKNVLLLCVHSASLRAVAVGKRGVKNVPANRAEKDICLI